MARQKDVTVNGLKITLQSVSPSWYYDLADRMGITGDTRKTAKYFDELICNCVIAPSAVAASGMGYFDEQDDLKTAEELVKEIESFLREEKQPRNGSKTGATQ